MASIDDRRFTTRGGERVRTGYKGDLPWRARWRESPSAPQKTKHFARKIDAKRFLDGVRADLLRGEYVRPEDGRVTFRDYAEQWRGAQVTKASTAKKVEQNLRLHVYPRLGNRPLASVRPSDVQARVRALSEALAPATVENVYTYAVAVFAAAVRDRLITRTPCDRIQLPKEHGREEVVVLTVDQVRSMADAMPERYRAAVWCGVGLGLRVGEVLGLTVDRVDFLRHSVKVDRQAAVDGGRELEPVKTRASNRVVPLPEVVAIALAEHLRKFPAGDDGRIFTTSMGNPMRRTAFGEAWARARKRAGLDGVKFHACRHTYASSLNLAGESVVVVQRRLGHESAALTLNVYGYLFPDADDRTRAAIDAAYSASPKRGKRAAED